MFQFILDWSEVWALLIPLTIILFLKSPDRVLDPIVIYVFVAFLLNTLATIMQQFYGQMPAGLKNNNILYNLHSLARVFFFGWYFGRITTQRLALVNKGILMIYSVLVILNFIFFESPFFLSPRLFAAESIVLLFLCISFFLRSIQDESHTNWTSQPPFLIFTGVALYEAITFFIFLFIYPIFNKSPEFAQLCMQIYQVIFVVYCIFLALALRRKRKKTVAA